MKLLRFFAQRRVPSAFALLMILAGVSLITLGTPSWWLGASLLVGAAVTLWHAFRDDLLRAHAFLSRPRRVLGVSVVPSTLLLDLVYVGILAWVATYMMRDVAYGARPISHDHTVHFVKAWQLHEHFLPRGRLYGWSHRWFAGYPVDYLYPIGTDLFVNAVHYLSLGFLRLSESYGVAFILCHVLTGYAGYRFGRVVGGPHVGLITGFLMITDMSAFRFGGWQYSVVYGVWPQALSLTLALLATAQLPAIYERRELRHLGVFALCMGASIVTHPIELIYLGLLFVAALLAAFFSPQVKTAAGTFRLLFAYALSAVVAAASLLPFLSARDQTTPMGVWWDSTYELGKGLVTLTAFPGTIGYVLVLAIPGAVIMLRSRRYVLLFTAFMALVIPTVSNSSFIDELHLPELSKAFTKIQWLRMSTMAKPFWFTLAAYCAVALVQKARELALAKTTPDAGAANKPYLRDVVMAVLVSYLTLPIVVPACQAFFISNINKVLATEADRADEPDRGRLVTWLKKNLPSGDGFYRVCVNTGHNHDLMDIAAELPVPIYKRGFTPAENFIYKVNVEDPAVIEAVNVRFMITKKPMPAELYEPLATFGVYRVYRFKRWNPQPFVVQKGQGDVKLERFGDDEIVLRAGTGSAGLLRLSVSYFPRWRAYHDGKPIALWPTALSEAPTSTGFMTVHLAPGLYRFVFEPSTLDKLSLPLSLLGVLLSFVLMLADRGKRVLAALRRALEAPTELFERLSAPRFALLRLTALVLGLSLLLAAMITLGTMQPKLALEHLDGAVVKRVRFDFLEQLASARVRIDHPGVQRRCKRFGDRFICRGQNDELDGEKYVASTPAEIEEYRMVRCIRARPEEGGMLVIDYPKVPAGDAVVGYYGVERAGRLMRLTRPVDFRVLIDGKVAYDGATESDNKMHWFRAPVPKGPERTVSVGFLVSARNVNKRYFCFHAQMADLGQGDAPPKAKLAPSAIEQPHEDDDEGEP